MISQLDTFLTHGRDITNTVMGTVSVSLSGGGILDGVWSTVMTDSEGADGGLQYEMGASVIVPAAAGITESIQGETCTYDGQLLRVERVEIGTVETTVYLVHETEGLT